jgi:hypothetical protein
VARKIIDGADLNVEEKKHITKKDPLQDIC